VEGEKTPAPGLGVDMQHSASFLYQSLYDIETKARSIAFPLRREIGLKDLGQNLRWYSRPTVAHREHKQRRGVVEVFNVEQAVLWSIFENSQIQGLPQYPAGN